MLTPSLKRRRSHLFQALVQSHLLDVNIFLHSVVILDLNFLMLCFFSVVSRPFPVRIYIMLPILSGAIHCTSLLPLMIFFPAL